ncbi:spermidine synthase [Dermabacteraceae bacterium P13136]
MARKAEGKKAAGGAPLEQDIEIGTGTARITRETDGTLTLFVNGVPSSEVHPDPLTLSFEYMRWIRCTVDELHAPPAPVRVTHLGGGACTLARAIAAGHPGSRQLVVELDRVLAENARAWFDLPRSPEVRVRAADAIATLPTLPEAGCDVLIRDVFAGDETPTALTTLAAAQQARRAVGPQGSYLVNCAAKPGTTLLADEYATLSEVFKQVHVIAEPGVFKKRRYGNCVLLASDMAPPEGLERALRRDAVTVRLLSGGDLAQLARQGSVITGAL